MTAYYNEIDPYAAQWLRNLIEAGAIAPGVVDERSIVDVKPSDLKGFTQCHFFAGIGVWSHALRRAGWADDRPIWTGSCPCQPFSSAGKGDGFADERHLWPAFNHLIKECKPTAVFGEQVASKDADAWIDLVQADMEALGYAFGAVPLASAGFGAPHIRERLYWVADSKQPNHPGQTSTADHIRSQTNGPADRDSRYCGPPDWLVHTDSHRCESWRIPASASRFRHTAYATGLSPGAPGPVNGHWRDADWIACRDGKWRPVEPGTSPLAARTPNHVGRLRAYGNAITAQVAEEFVMAYLES